MPAYRFSWDAFDDATVLALASDIGFSGPSAEAKAYLKARVARPDDAFVKRTRDSIAAQWLARHERVAIDVVRELFDRQIGPMGAMPVDAKGCADYVRRCRNSRGLRTLLAGRMISFGDRDRPGDEDLADGFVPRFVTVVPAKQTPSQPKPYPHQVEAWAALDRHLSEARATGVFKGVLVMPTGSGKTRTAVQWLLSRWFNEKPQHRVLWIAHRDELLRQAARSFFEQAALANSRNRLRVRLVSGGHCAFHQIDPEDDVIVCSVGSLARNLSGAERLLTDPNLFVVIDEAHHAPARSYSEAIDVLASAGSHRLLGLTATPTRTATHERPKLSRLFGDREIYQVSAATLVAREILARPIPASVSTGVDAESGMTTEELRHLSVFREVAPETRERLGRNASRNNTIVAQYLRSPEKYGKTLVFAPDVEGAALLADAFRHQLPPNVKAAYLASWRPDGTDSEWGGDREVLDAFRDPKSGLDVLVNVDILTEGVDLPITRTVFLARPTSSEILMRQMIGRALRGPAAGGNREAHIVSFDDHWSRFRDILSPIDLLSEFAEPEPHEEDGAVATPGKEPMPGGLPKESWESILAVSRDIRLSREDSDADVFEAVPHGMYPVEWTADGEVVRHVIHVYDHQRSCWDALLNELHSSSTEQRARMDAQSHSDDYFGDCEDPLPSFFDIATLLERAREGDPRPEFVLLEGRGACDPRALARLVNEQNLRISEVNALLTERYSALARVIYPTAHDFRRAFDDAMRDDPSPPKGVVQFEAPPSGGLRPGPTHDLNGLFREMAERGASLLGAPISLEKPIAWTKRIIKGWYGVAHIAGERVGQIRVNCLLDSPDISAETLRFLLWHEYLHIHLRQQHTPEFRRLERMWPDYRDCDRELDSLNERFGVQYW